MLRVPLVSSALARAGRRKFLNSSWSFLPAFKSPKEVLSAAISSSRAQTFIPPVPILREAGNPSISRHHIPPAALFFLQAFGLIIFYLSLIVTILPFVPFEATNR